MDSETQPPSITPGGNPPPEPPEPMGLAAARRGWFTTEFILSGLASLLGWLVAAGVFADGSAMAAILGAGVAVLASLGYSASRAVTKSSEAKAMASAADSVARERAVKALQDPTKRSRSTE